MNEKVDMIDGIFLSFSAVTSTGLSTVSMVDLSPASFAVLVILILCGGSLLLPLAPLLYRRFIYAKIKASYPSQFRIDNAPVLSEFDIQDRALLVMIRIIITYVAAVMFMGFLIIYAAMHLEEDDPELASRGYSREANAAFLSISAFNNAGVHFVVGKCFPLAGQPGGPTSP
jgi:Trk-type K+ transport system membrane component